MIRVDHWHAAQVHERELTDLVFAEMARLPRSHLSVATGWSGPKTLFDDFRTHPLQRFIHDALGELVHLSGWANVMRPGDVVESHDHVRSHLGGDNTWAGVYYLTGGSALVVAESVSVGPTPGMLVLFPAATAHRVQRHSGTELRVSIAFNARLMS